MKKILAMVLALCMILALVACGAKPEAETEVENQGNTSDADDAAADTGDDAASDDGMETPYGRLDDPYEIVWYYGGTAQADMEMVQTAVAEYVNEKLGTNITLDMVATPYGELGDKMSMVLASGEKWDLCFTSSWANLFTTNATNGAYLALNDLLPVYAPEMYEDIGGYWKSVTMDGNIYAVPNIQLEYLWAFSAIPTKWVEMYNATNPSVLLVQENIHHITDLNDFYYWAKENIIDAGVDLNGVVPSYCNWGNFSDGMSYNIEECGTAGVYLEFGDESLTVKSMWDFEDYIKATDTYYQWYQDGITQSDIVTVDRTQSDLASLAWIEYDHPTFKPDEDENQYKYWNLNPDENELTFFTYGDAWASTDAVIATTTAVSAKCERPDIVLSFMNLLNTDGELFDLLCFGIEGYHYDVVDGCVVTSTENTGYDPNNDWGFGNQFNATPREGLPANVWEETAELNTKANIACDMGFLPNLENVATQVANLSVVREQYHATFKTGAFPGTFDEWQAYKEEYKNAMYEAGLQDIIDEIQGQLNAWKEANS